VQHQKNKEETMAFDPNTDIKPADMLVLEMIKNDPNAILKCALGIDKKDEYSTGIFGVLMSMHDFIMSIKAHKLNDNGYLENFTEI
jgi:hypothetical protein